MKYNKGAKSLTFRRGSEVSQGMKRPTLYYRGLNNYQYYCGVPYSEFSMMGPQTLLILKAPISDAKTHSLNPAFNYHNQLLMRFLLSTQHRI